MILHSTMGAWEYLPCTLTSYEQLECCTTLAVGADTEWVEQMHRKTQEKRSHDTTVATLSLPH